VPAALIVGALAVLESSLMTEGDMKIDADDLVIGYFC
jgi:hypothetical protein